MDVREKPSNEKRLIDANALNRTLYPIAMDLSNEYGSLGGAVSGVIKHIDNAPTVDAVPVVRCRECEHWKPTGSKAGNSFSDMEYIGGCEFTKYCRRESDFCSYGERKEGLSMNEYIEREEAYEDFEKCNSVNPKWTPGRVKALIARQKTADVAPVRHGRWDENGRCTVCGGHAPFWSMSSTYYESPYCFECGADMRGKYDE